LGFVLDWSSSIAPAKAGIASAMSAAIATSAPRRRAIPLGVMIVRILYT